MTRDNARARIRDALRVGPGTAAQLADRARLSRPTAYEALRQLRELGETESWKRPGTRARIWRAS